VAVLLQGGASQAQTVSSQPSLKELVAEATQLSNEVDSLGQQYDGLKIQLAHANSEVKIAKLAAARADAAMAGSEKAVAQLAAMGYMNGGMDPTLQMLTSGNPNLFLGQASTVQPRSGRRPPPRKRSRPPTSCSRRSTARSAPSTPS
jgi:peptidoglycan DL-endopeptidase CwlO